MGQQDSRLPLLVIAPLLEASNAANTQDALARSLQVVLEALGGTFGVAYFSSWGELELVAERGPVPELLTGSRLVGLESPIGRMCSGGARVLPLETQEGADAAFLRGLAGPGCSALVVLPLAARAECLGCVCIGCPAAEPIQALGQDRLDSLGLAVGLVVENARLHRQLDSRLREGEALYKVSKALVSTLQLDDILGLVVHSATETIEKANNAVLHLLDEKTGELRPRALTFVGQVVRPDQTGRSGMRSGRGVAGQVVETGQIVNIADVSKDPRFLRVGSVRPFASMLVVPLSLGERHIGTLSVDSLETHAFSPDDERLLLTLATQAAAAIENARLVSDLQHSVTELRTTQEQLVQSEKLSAIGQLIAGVAHELNNPLTAVMGYAQLVQMSEGLDERVVSDLGRIQAQAQRAAKIVQNLLTFARQHKVERQYVDVNEVLERTLELRGYHLRVENIVVDTQLEQRELGTLADPNQLQQVFLNLINNAQDAMIEAHHGGRLLVRSEQRGDRIVVSIADNGPGLPLEVQKHLFEPFFTTKEVGRGTGLGLSICYGIVSQHGGRIWADSVPGQGATFYVELVVASPASLGGEAAKPATPTVSPRIVLVVDDEVDITALVERMLTQDGHRVYVAHSGEVALQRLAELRRQGYRPDLILSDIKMPGLDGRAFYEFIRSHDPALLEHLAFATGDSLSTETRSFLQEVGRPYISKPFGVEELRALMLQMLGAAG